MRAATNREDVKSGTPRPYDEHNDSNNDLPPAYEATSSASSDPINTSRPPPAQSYHNIPQGYPNQAHPWQGPGLGYPQMGTSPYQYPPGFMCGYCHNTGIKLHNGHPCGNCERMFGRQAANVQYAPANMMPLGGVTYMAGDPRIGGRLCGNCKGRGIRASLFGFVEEQCFVCRGIGRILS